MPRHELGAGKGIFPKKVPILGSYKAACWQVRVIRPILARIQKYSSVFCAVGITVLLQSLQPLPVGRSKIKCARFIYFTALQ